MNEKKYGLTTREAEINKKYGTNELSQRESESFLDMLKDSFKDTWVIILLVALGLKILFSIIGMFWPEIGGESEWIESIAIGISILAITFIGTFMNYRQDRGAQALQKEAAKIRCKVYRDGKLVELSINDIVIGDYVQLQPGDMVPADCVLRDGSIMVNQAAINGESRDAKKIVLGDNPIPDSEDLFTELKAFRGTVVTSGSAVVEVTEVGDNTVVGDVNRSLQEKNDEITPSEEKLNRLAKYIGVFGYIGGSVAAIINVVLGLMNAPAITFGFVANLVLSSIILGVSIIVMAVPEGLPLMNILVQALNVGKMLKAHIYVRNPKSIETAGYLKHLFTDKTGTLTEGNMRVVNVITGVSKVVEFFENIPAAIRDALIIGAGINNDATVSGDGAPIGSNDTDRALISYLAIENGCKIDKSNVKHSEAFDSRVKFASVTMNDGTIYYKGAPEIVMSNCKYYLDDSGKKQALTQKVLKKLKETWNQQTERAMRVIGVVKEVNGEKIFVCLVSIRDDVRKDVKGTIARLKKAGVKVTMVTGDVITTAKAIAKECGLVIDEAKDICLTHDDLAALSNEEVKKIIPNLAVVARAVPADKERLVMLSQEMGEVVGMTGDGVNDAAALHKADVGFAMGSGTEVAKEAGDIIILNDSLTSISDAIMYGRTMSKSVKKFIIFQLTVNVSTVFTAVLGPIFGWTEVFTIVQILWINLIMDTLAALAFGQEPAREAYMEEKPILRTADILNGYLKSAIFTGGVFITVVCQCILNNAFGIHELIGTTEMENVRSFMFATFILAVIWNSFNARTESLNLFENLSKNKGFLMVMGGVTLVQILIIQFGGAMFGTTPLSLSNWLLAIAIGFLIIPIDMIRKVIVKRMGIKE